MNIAPGLCLPTKLGIFTYPWAAIARHSTALLFYGFACMQWPGSTVPQIWQEKDQVFGFSLASWLFTLVFWCACFFHYLLSAGRVEVNWITGVVRARGWVVRSSRKAHRIILSLTLTVTALTMLQTTTMEAIIHHVRLNDRPPPTMELRDNIILLKIDQTLAFFFFIFVLGRLVFEPIGMQKNNKTKLDSLKKKGKDGENKEEVIICPEECSICVTRWANRQLGCGHQLCCCCLLEIFKSTAEATRCPFCRADIHVKRRLHIQDGGLVDYLDCCSAPTFEELSNELLNKNGYSRTAQTEQV